MNHNNLNDFEKVENDLMNETSWGFLHYKYIRVFNQITLRPETESRVT